MSQLIELFVSAIIGVISASGYWGILVLMALESACLPLPSEVIMPFGGYLVTTGQLSLFWVATAGAVGCNVGSTVAYYAGKWAGRPAIERWGRYVLITPHDIELTDRFFKRFGSAAVFIARLLPVVRSFVALPAGFAEMNMWKFQIYTFVGSWIWCFGLAYLGQQLGEKWNSDPQVRAWFHSADIVIALLLAVGASWWIWRHIRAMRGS